MRTLNFLPVVALLVLVACNNSSDQASAAKDTAKAAMDTMNMNHDTMNMNHAADTSKMITPVPPVPPTARVFFKNLKNGETVSSPVKVEMGIEGMKLDTAGKIVVNSGHHHLLIDAEDSLASGTVVMKDDKHMHFGKAQSSVELTLAPGKHKLALQYADGIHRSYGGQLSKSITITVK